MRRGDRTAVIPARAGHRPLIKHITVATQIPIIYFPGVNRLGNFIFPIIFFKMISIF